LNAETEGCGDDVAMFKERLDFVRESLRAAEQKCQYLERSIGAQVQTVSIRRAMRYQHCFAS
jgi:hypothetical protein